MAEEKALPFHSFTFALLEDRQPRASFRMTAAADDLFELHVQKGSAANPLVQFERKVPREVAERLRDSLQALGVFGWEESYGDTTAPGTRRWSMSLVFQKDVFAIESKGGSDVPAGFDGLLEELHRLDFPRPAGGRSGAGATGGKGLGVGSAINALGLGGRGSLGGMSAGDLGAFASGGIGSPGIGGTGGIDFSQLAGPLGTGLGSLDAREIQDLLSQSQSNPQALQQRMKEEFQHLSPDEQNQMLDALAATGMATREWWERFLRG